MRQRLIDKLLLLYGAARAEAVYQQLIEVIGKEVTPPPNDLHLSERDVILIAYGDHVRRDGQAPLATLRDVLRDTIGSSINSLHILPFFPYSSDDGFSVIDYYAVNPDLGTWDDIAALGSDFRLMFDAVFNHMSAQSAWFQAFLRGEAPYKDWFVVVDPTTDLSMVTRPRALPLLTPFQTADGEKHLWTTFSADQVDLNFANPDVLLEMIRVLLFYVEQGADLIRLDAIAFLWKQPGTTSIHLPETHAAIQVMRDVLDVVAPHVILITETNVPHDENISYFGDGTNEAQMVYQFSLPPLVLHTFHTGDSTALTQWAKTIQRSSDRTTFFNFTASHDGIGMRPATGLLTQAQIDALVQLATDHGGRVSYRATPDGGQSPYELNITYFDAITDPQITATDPDLAVRRFIASQAIMLAMVGVPGVYFHSLYGSRNFNAGAEQSGHNRTINREKPNADQLL
ncbi:MAG: sugar phosphorylase, partial [Chloroflexi bacterium]|nr:sugar phosphorylase [Chloroflexota bacterium]